MSFFLVSDFECPWLLMKSGIYLILEDPGILHSSSLLEGCLLCSRTSSVSRLVWESIEVVEGGGGKMSLLAASLALGTDTRMVLCRQSCGSSSLLPPPYRYYPTEIKKNCLAPTWNQMPDQARLIHPSVLEKAGCIVEAEQPAQKI